MKKSLIVVDDFYTNPYAVRDFALSMQFTLTDYETGYPGFESDGNLPKELMPQIFNCFSGLIGKKLVLEEGDPQGRFRIQDNKTQNIRKNIIHSDACDWSGLIYLSLPKYCKGTLNIYQHKETKLKRLYPIDSKIEHVMKQKSLAYDELKCWLVEEGLNEHKWNVVNSIEHKFNRLIIFDGGQFHGVQTLFGSNKENSRLSQHFFFNEAKN